MLDLTKLELTPEEWRAAYEPTRTVADGHLAIARAQLAKALDGIVAHLKSKAAVLTNGKDRVGGAVTLSNALDIEQAARAAGLEWPKEGE